MFSIVAPEWRWKKKHFSYFNGIDFFNDTVMYRRLYLKICFWSSGWGNARLPRPLAVNHNAPVRVVLGRNQIVTNFKTATIITQRRLHRIRVWFANHQSRIKRSGKWSLKTVIDDVFRGTSRTGLNYPAILSSKPARFTSLIHRDTRSVHINVIITEFVSYNYLSIKILSEVHVRETNVQRFDRTLENVQRLWDEWALHNLCF